MSKLYLLLEDQIQDPSQNDTQQAPPTQQVSQTPQQEDPLLQYEKIIRRELFNKIQDIKNTLSNTKNNDNKSLFEIVQFTQIILDYYDVFDTKTVMGIIANITTELEKVTKK